MFCAAAFFAIGYEIVSHERKQPRGERGCLCVFGKRVMIEKEEGEMHLADLAATDFPAS